MKKLSSKQIFTYVALFAIIILAAVYFLVYQKNVEKAEALAASNDNLESRVNSLKVYYDNEKMYEADMEPKKEEIAKILAKYPVDIREEDVIMQAVITQMTTPLTYSSVNIAEVEEMSKIAIETVQGAAMEEYQEAIVFNERSATYANELDYMSLKAAIQSLFDSEYVIGIKGITYTGQTKESETGEEETILNGTFDLSYYSVSGTGKEYVTPNITPYVSGTDNLFDKVEVVE